MDHLKANTHPDWFDLDPEQDDILLLTKDRISSQKLAHKPLLLLPAAIIREFAADYGDFSQLTHVEPNLLGDRVVNEFRKTAQLVSQPPWNLLRACAYLTGLCDRQELVKAGKYTPSELVCIDNFWSHKRVIKAMPMLCDDRSHWEEARETRLIEIKRVQPGKMRKRLGQHLLESKNKSVKKRPASAEPQDASQPLAP
jgi:hypothetical protein